MYTGCMGERRGAYRVYGGEEGCIQGWGSDLRDGDRPRHRWEDNIKMDLEEVGWGHGLD